MSSARSFAIIQQFMLGDLEALDALVGDDADELLADDGRDLGHRAAASSECGSAARQVDAWLNERRTRLAESS